MSQSGGSRQRARPSVCGEIVAKRHARRRPVLDALPAQQACRLARAVAPAFWSPRLASAMSSMFSSPGAPTQRPILRDMRSSRRRSGASALAVACCSLGSVWRPDVVPVIALVLQNNKHGIAGSEQLG
eukprot:6706813-Lingulodinium_polyedra.AAC.1